jgi:hypothetical protein
MLMAFGSRRVPREIIRIKRRKEKECRKEMHNEELQYSYCLPNRILKDVH